MNVPRLALTSTPTRSEELVGLVRHHGCEPVVLPCIETRPARQEAIEGARAATGQADWLLITSPRTVATLWPDGGMPPVKVAVVGKATGEAVRLAGGNVAAMGESGLEELFDVWAGETAGHAVFFPHSAASDLSRLKALAEKGARVATAAVYETKPIPPRNDPVDAVLFASPSATAGWLRSRSLEDLVIAAIGASTATSLSELGHPPHIVPLRPDFEMLIDQTARYLRDRSLV